MIDFVKVTDDLWVVPDHVISISRNASRNLVDVYDIKINYDIAGVEDVIAVRGSEKAKEYQEKIAYGILSRKIRKEASKCGNDIPADVIKAGRMHDDIVSRMAHRSSVVINNVSPSKPVPIEWMKEWLRNHSIPEVSYLTEMWNDWKKENE